MNLYVRCLKRNLFICLLSLIFSSVACENSGCVIDSTIDGGFGGDTGGNGCGGIGAWAGMGGVGDAGSTNSGGYGGMTSSSTAGNGNCGGETGTTTTPTGGSNSGGSGGTLDTTPPFVNFTVPAHQELDVALNSNVSATFSEEISISTLTIDTFTLADDNGVIPAKLTYAGTVGMLDPIANLSPNTMYTATITTYITDLAGNPLVFAKVWGFSTGTDVALGPAPVSLGTAANFVILSKSGIDTVPISAITGDVGVSPIDSTAITGFSLILDSSTTFATSNQIIGKAYAADYTPPTPSNLTTAISNMEAAFTDAAGRPAPDFTELAAGDISGLTLVPGLYKWGTGILISTDITLEGGPNDVWIFQISGGITQASGATMILSGGAQAKNIFWQNYGAVALDTGAHFEGIVLSKTEITFATGASINGRLLSQTAVTLDNCVIIQPN